MSEKAEQIREWFRKDSSRMTMVASRQFEVPEQEVLEALLTEWPINKLRAEAFTEIMDALKEVGLVRIFVRSRTCVMECDGTLGDAEYSVTGPFFNIDGGGLDMHIMFRDITAAYTMEKQSHMNPEDNTYSILFFDSKGEASFKVFLWQDFPKTPVAVVEKFKGIIEKFAVSGEAANA